MTLRMSEKVLDINSKVIDDLEEDFQQKVKQFTKDVKTTMKAAPHHTAMKIFQFALAFLTQSFPDLSNLGASLYREKGDERIKLLEQNFEKLFKRLSDVEAKIQTELSATLNYLESKIPDSYSVNKDVLSRVSELETKEHDNLGLKKIAEKLNDLETEVWDDIYERLSYVEDKLQKDFAELNETCQSNSQGVTGLRKLIQLLKLKPGTFVNEEEKEKGDKKKKKKSKTLQAKASSSSTATATNSTSSQGSASAVASTYKSLQGLSPRSTFSAQALGDASIPGIIDMKLLPGGFILLADSSNFCVKIFNEQGQHTSRLFLYGQPLRLTILNSSPCGWDVAVSVYEKGQIALIYVTKTSAVFKCAVPLSKPCCAVATINKSTLAVGYWSARGIDLIDISGRVLRNLSFDVYPNYMEVSPDGHLLVSESDFWIVNIKVADGSIVYRHKLHKVQNPRAITCLHQDASFIVAEQETRTLHLISPSGSWVRELWEKPFGGFKHDRLASVTALGDKCLCCTEHGFGFLLDVTY